MKKVIFRIPTEQYGYVEIEDDIDEGFFDGEKLLEQYKSFKETFSENKNVGLSDKEFNAFLDTYLFDGTGSADVYAAMNKTQQEFIQTLKRSLKRIKRNEPSIE